MHACNSCARAPSAHVGLPRHAHSLRRYAEVPCASVTDATQPGREVLCVPAGHSVRHHRQAGSRWRPGNRFGTEAEVCSSAVGGSVGTDQLLRDGFGSSGGAGRQTTAATVGVDDVQRFACLLLSRGRCALHSDERAGCGTLTHLASATEGPQGRAPRGMLAGAAAQGNEVLRPNTRVCRRRRSCGPSEESTTRTAHTRTHHTPTTEQK